MVRCRVQQVLFFRLYIHVHPITDPSQPPRWGAGLAAEVFTLVDFGSTVDATAWRRASGVGSRRLYNPLNM